MSESAEQETILQKADAVEDKVEETTHDLVTNKVEFPEEVVKEIEKIIDARLEGLKALLHNHGIRL